MIKEKSVRKKLRGMTLVEIIISIAIFGILCLLVVTAALSVEKHSRAATKLNKKVAVQGPIAEAQNEKGANLIDEKAEIKIKMAGGTEIVINGKLYNTADLQPVTDSLGMPATDSNGNPQYEPVTDDSIDAQLNLKYIADIEPITATTAAVSTTTAVPTP